MAKTLADTYLYGMTPDYNKKILTFILKAERINTKSSEFADVLFDIKRRKLSDSLSKIITSNNTVIGIYPDCSLPKAFRTFVAKDPKDGNKPKLFIDATEYIKFKNGHYDCIQIDWFTSYIIAGTTNYIYKMLPRKLTLNSSIISDGCDCFTRLFSYVIDRIYKVTSVQVLKKKIDYAIALYYQINLLEKDCLSEGSYRVIRNNAMKISNIDAKDANLVDIRFKPENFTNILTFTTALTDIFDLKDFRIDVFVSTWISAFGTGTPFALEYFPAFAMMITNSYVGGYIDNQNMIEKITGNSMVILTKTLFKIGESVV